MLDFGCCDFAAIFGGHCIRQQTLKYALNFSMHYLCGSPRRRLSPSSPAIKMPEERRGRQGREATRMDLTLTLPFFSVALLLLFSSFRRYPLPFPLQIINMHM
jgi:hypothetical protein